MAKLLLFVATVACYVIFTSLAQKNTNELTEDTDDSTLRNGLNLKPKTISTRAIKELIDAKRSRRKDRRRTTREPPLESLIEKIERIRHKTKRPRQISTTQKIETVMTTEKYKDTTKISSEITTVKPEKPSEEYTTKADIKTTPKDKVIICKPKEEEKDSNEEDNSEDTYDNESTNSKCSEDSWKRKCSNDEYQNDEISGAESRTAMSSTTSDDQCIADARKSLMRAYITFGGKLFSEMLATNPGKNIIGSTPTILTLLSSLALFAKGKSFTEIMKATNFDDVKYIKCVYPPLLEQVLGESSVQYDMYSKVYADHRCPLTDEFIETTTDIFTSAFTPENQNFSDPVSTDIINKEIADSTSSRIKNPVKSEVLTKLTELVLIDSTAFTGTWEDGFDPKETTDRDFRISLFKSKKVPTMHKKGTFLYTNSIQLQAKVLKLKYAGDKYSLAIVLPYFTESLKNVQKKLQDPDTFIKVFDSLKPRKVDVYLPKFNLTGDNKLKSVVKKAGVTAIFDKSTSEVEGVVTCENPIVTEILQSTSLAVEESGMEYTVDSDSAESVPMKAENSLLPRSFRADRPFIFYLFYEKFTLYYGAYVE